MGRASPRWGMRATPRARPRGGATQLLAATVASRGSRVEARASDVVAEVRAPVPGDGRLQDVGVHRPERRLRLVAHAGRKRLDDPFLEARPLVRRQHVLALMPGELVEVTTELVVLQA